MYTYIIYKSTNQACKRACTSRSSFESFSSLYQSHTTKSVSSLLLLSSSASLLIFSRVETLLFFLSTLAARLALSHSYCFLVWRPVSSHRQGQGCPACFTACSSWPRSCSICPPNHSFVFGRLRFGIATGGARSS